MATTDLDMAYDTWDIKISRYNCEHRSFHTCYNEDSKSQYCKKETCPIKSEDKK